MKLKRNIQRVLVVIFMVSFVTIMLTIESEFTWGFIKHLATNVVLLVTTGLMLAKYGVWE